MNVIRDRIDARGLPTRFNFALFRLAAFLRMSGSPAREAVGTIMAIDRDQSAIENYTVAAWVFFTTTCFLTDWFARALPLVLAIFLAIAATPWILQLPLYVIGAALPHGRMHRRAISTATFVLLGAAALWSLSRPGWIRWAGIQFLALITINALAALVMLFLRERVHDMERACGA